MSAPHSATEQGTGFGDVNPIFWVRDFEASIATCVGLLGFKLERQAPGLIASVIGVAFPSS
jgi:hypothetical protein